VLMYQLIGICFVMLCYANLLHASPLAPVSGFARDFISGKPVSRATITILETKQQLTTDRHGRFGPFLYPVGQALTLEFKKWGYKTTQSGTLINPAEGLTKPNTNITFQIPSLFTFYLFKIIIGEHFKSGDCHVVTTVTAPQKTLDDLVQGEENATIKITPLINEKPFYFDIFKNGPLKNRTDPFNKTLTVTTRDGGVAFVNVPASANPYTITATKKGKTFTSAKFICHPNSFINISPPNGPMVME